METTPTRPKARDGATGLTNDRRSSGLRINDHEMIGHIPVDWGKKTYAGSTREGYANIPSCRSQKAGRFGTCLSSNHSDITTLILVCIKKKSRVVRVNVEEVVR